MNKQLSLFSHVPAQENHKKTQECITIFIDGAARGNPGDAGAGIFIVGDTIPSLKKGLYLGHKTNNQAEYLALVFALLFTRDLVEKYAITNPHLSIFSDSELLIKQMKGIYKIKNHALAQLKHCAESLLTPYNVQWSHVVREKNKEADRLANLGVDKKSKIPAHFLKILHEHGLSFY
jgi:ribonuclease HI